MAGLTHLSLFSGIGGIDLAAEAAGFETVAFVEREPFCQNVLRHHWPGVPIFDDVREVTAHGLRAAGVEAVDLLSGGFPCQPFSRAGQREGTGDDRHLWPQMARLIGEVRPTWVLGENVDDLLSSGIPKEAPREGIDAADAGGTLGAVLRDLDTLGYRAGWGVYGAGDLGAPHRRNRVFIVARRDDGMGNASCWRQQLARQTVCSGRDAPWLSSGDGMGYTICGGFGWESWRRPGSQFTHGHSQSDTRKTVDVCERRGTTDAGADKPSLGRTVDGLPTWLDGSTWPASPREAQHSWEPPRVAQGIKNRVKRLKALGNAVVPAQVFPILKAIAQAEQEKASR